MDKYIEEAQKALENIAGDEYTVQYQVTKKTNGVEKDSFIIRAKEGDNKIAPVFYLDESARQHLTPEQFAERTYSHYLQEMERGPIQFNIMDFEDIDYIKSHVSFNIVNAHLNAGDLITFPVTDDLAIALKIQISPSASIRLHEHHMDLWNGEITKEELLQHSLENAVIFDAPTMRSMRDVIMDMMIDRMKSEMPEMTTDEIIEMLEDEIPTGDQLPIYVLSTESQSSAVLMYPDCLENIRQDIGSFIIICSSTRELLLIPMDDALAMGYEHIKSMVESVNRDVVMQDDATEFLSDELLAYTENGLVQVTDFNMFYDQQNR